MTSKYQKIETEQRRQAAERVSAFSLCSKSFRRADEAHCDALRPQLKEIFKPSDTQSVFTFEASWHRGLSSTTTIAQLKHAFQRALQRYRRSGPFIAAGIMVADSDSTFTTRVRLRGLIKTGEATSNALALRAPRCRVSCPTVRVAIKDLLQSRKAIARFIDETFVRLATAIPFDSSAGQAVFIENGSKRMIVEGEHLKRALKESGERARWCFIGMRCDGGRLKVVERQAPRKMKRDHMDESGMFY